MTLMTSVFLSDSKNEGFFNLPPKKPQKNLLGINKDQVSLADIIVDRQLSELKEKKQVELIKDHTKNEK